jgi:undecaprenyl-diphosphatase
LLVFYTQAAFFLNGLLKNFVCRERPCQYYGYSFPSTHATVEMCFYGICIYLVLRYVRNEFWRYFIASVFGIFIFMVCLSRLWLGVHFLTDIIAGLSLGVILINLYIITVNSLKN